MIALGILHYLDEPSGTVKFSIPFIYRSDVMVIVLLVVSLSSLRSWIEAPVKQIQIKQCSMADNMIHSVVDLGITNDYRNELLSTSV